MKTVNGVMHMSKEDYLDLSEREQINQTYNGEVVLYNGYAYKIKVTCKNRVQFAYNEFKAHSDTFDSCLDSDSRDKFFAKNTELSRAVWYAIAESTKEINPSLKSDIDKGNYDSWYLLTSQKHFVDINWQIFPEGTKCLHCGEVHHP